MPRENPIKIGDRFFHWTVTGGPILKYNRIKHWQVECECGNVKLIQQYYLLQGKSRSCGCKREVSPQTRQLLSELRLGASHTPETISKISASQKATWAAKNTQTKKEAHQ